MRFFGMTVLVAGFVIALAGATGMGRVVDAQGTTAPAAAASAPVLPEGEGREIVQKKCQECHNLDTVTSNHATPQEWSRLVEQMISNGADLSEDEEAKVVKYLAANFGPVKSAAPASTPATPAATPNQ